MPDTSSSRYIRSRHIVHDYIRSPRCSARALRQRCSVDEANTAVERVTEVMLTLLTMFVRIESFHGRKHIGAVADGHLAAAIAPVWRKGDSLIIDAHNLPIPRTQYGRDVYCSWLCAVPARLPAHSEQALPTTEEGVQAHFVTILQCPIQRHNCAAYHGETSPRIEHG